MATKRNYVTVELAVVSFKDEDIVRTSPVWQEKGESDFFSAN